MPGRILGLEISQDAVALVQVKSGLKGYEITACARAPYEGEAGPAEAFGGLVSGMDLKSDLCMVSIPGEEVSFRNVTMPFKDPKKIRLTLPGEIEDTVPFPLEELVVDFTAGGRDGQSDILAACVKKEVISNYLSILNQYGFDPAVIDIRCIPLLRWLLRRGSSGTGLYLDIGARSSTLALYLEGHIALVRTFGSPLSSSQELPLNPDGDWDARAIETSLESLCTQVQNTVHAFEAQIGRPFEPEAVYFSGVGALYSGTGALLQHHLDIPSEAIDLSTDKRIHMNGRVAKTWNRPLMDGALALALRETRHREPFNFRKGEFEVKKQYLGLIRELRKVAVLAAVILGLLIVDLGIGHYALKRRYAALDQRVTEVFRQTFPDVNRIVDPLQQMKVRVNQLKGGESLPSTFASDTRVIELLQDISRRVPESVDLDIGTMIIDPEKVRLTGTTDTFNMVDTIKNRLAPSAYFSEVVISSANLERSGERVQFELKLQRSR